MGAGGPADKSALTRHSTETQQRRGDSRQESPRIQRFSLAWILNLFRARRADALMADTNQIAATPVQKVVVVDGNAEVLRMLEAVLDAGRYDMVFVESSDHAYSQIRKVVPNLVILCANVELPEAFQLLTMLKLDPATRDIAVLTYTTEGEGQDLEASIAQLAEEEDDLLPSRQAPALRMH